MTIVNPSTATTLLSFTKCIQHRRSAPYYPNSNVEAERFVQTLKDALKSAGADATIAMRLTPEFLLCYRVSAHGTTGASPSQLLGNRAPRTKLNLIYQNMKLRVCLWQEYDKVRFDYSANTREINAKEAVSSRNYLPVITHRLEFYISEFVFFRMTLKSATALIIGSLRSSVNALPVWKTYLRRK